MKTLLHPFFGKLTTTRLNAELQRIFASGLKTHINADLPEWIQLAPYGEWPTSERNADGKPEAVQIFTREDGKELVKRFNAWHRRLARLARMNSCKAYVGHPDFAPDIWPKRVELGDVVELSDDEHGVNGRMRWNSDVGDDLKKNPFPSVAWDTEELGEGKERPVMLWSVGMTSKPNIKGVKSAINAAPDATPENDPEPEPTNKPPHMINKIKKALVSAGLAKDDDDDDLIQQHVGNMIAQMGQQKQWAAQEKARADRFKTALNAEFPDVDAGIEASLTRLNDATTQATSLTGRINALTTERDAVQKSRLNTALDYLVETGRLTKAESEDAGAEGVRARLNADFEKVLTELRAKPARLNTRTLDLREAKPVVYEAHERSTRLNAWCEAHMQAKNCSWDAAGEASKKDKETAPLHEAMNAADAARQQQD